MWTPESRGRLAKIARKTKRYPSDLTDGEWSAVEPPLTAPAQTGRERRTDLREELVLIEGHTDEVGLAAYNLPLSRERAEAIKAAITQYSWSRPRTL